MAYRDKYPQYKYDDICAYILLDKNGDARLPRNYEIDISIKNMPFYTQKKEYVQLVLSSIDDQNKESKILKGFTQDNDKLSIEHIMPQKLNEAWKNDLGSDYENIHQQYLHTLANLTLTGYNSTYSNHSFNKKKTMEFGFDSSPLAINKSVNKFNKWDLAAIEERNNWWKEQIDKLWKLPVTTFQPDVNKKEYFFIEAPIEGEKIKSLTVFGKEYICKNWIDGYAIIIENILLNNDFDADKLEASSLNKFLSINPSSMTSSSQINGSIYYYEKSLSNSHKKEIVRKLLELFDIDSSEIMVVIQ